MWLVCTLLLLGTANLSTAFGIRNEANAPLRSHFSNNGMFGERIRDWFNNVKHQILSWWIGTVTEPTGDDNLSDDSYPRKHTEIDCSPDNPCEWGVSDSSETNDYMPVHDFASDWTDKVTLQSSSEKSVSTQTTLSTDSTTHQPERTSVFTDATLQQQTPFLNVTLAPSVTPAIALSSVTSSSINFTTKTVNIHSLEEASSSNGFVTNHTVSIPISTTTATHTIYNKTTESPMSESTVLTSTVSSKNTSNEPTNQEHTNEIENKNSDVISVEVIIPPQ